MTLCLCNRMLLIHICTEFFQLCTEKLLSTSKKKKLKENCLWFFFCVFFFYFHDPLLDWQLLQLLPASENTNYSQIHIYTLKPYGTLLQPCHSFDRGCFFVFFRLGCPGFTKPEHRPSPVEKGVSKSLFFPDEAINRHPRFRYVFKHATMWFLNITTNTHRHSVMTGCDSNLKK